MCTRSGERLVSMGTESTSLLLILVVSDGTSSEPDSVASNITNRDGVTLTQCNHCASLLIMRGNVVSSITACNEFSRQLMCALSAGT